jgi:preprotein translocase subunit SecG
MAIALTVLFFVIALLLIAVVLLQSGGSGGIGFIGGGGTQSAFGTKTGNVMTKVTTTLAALFLIVSFVLGYLNSRRERVDIRELEEVQETVGQEEQQEEDGDALEQGEFQEDIGVDVTE